MRATTVWVMGPRPDPLAAYLDAMRAGETGLAELLAQRLFPGSRGRRPPSAPEVSPGAQRVLETLIRGLGL